MGRPLQSTEQWEQTALSLTLVCGNPQSENFQWNILEANSSKFWMPLVIAHYHHFVPLFAIVLYLSQYIIHDLNFICKDKIRSDWPVSKMSNEVICSFWVKDRSYTLNSAPKPNSISKWRNWIHPWDPSGYLHLNSQLPLPWVLVPPSLTSKYLH